MPISRKFFSRLEWFPWYGGINNKGIRLRCTLLSLYMYYVSRRWLGNAMVLGKLSVPGRPSNFD